MISTQFCPACGAANEVGQTYCFACGYLLTTGMEGSQARDEALLHNRYQLGALLGSGGYSAVYRARDLETGRQVAIKQVTLRELGAAEMIEATDTFNRERSLLSALRHPQIPRLYDHFSGRDHWYLVMEYLEGTTLETYLEMLTQGKAIQVDEVLAMGLQLCRVLEYLHTREPPVIFRDLKPGNIIRTPGGSLCLIDFGIARHFRPGQARDTQPLGSPGYAAPEQYGRAQSTPQTDIYSLGALLHALLSGHDPAGQAFGLSPLRLNSSTAEIELEALTQRMLSPDPSQRPTTASEVARTLEAIRQQSRVQNTTRIWQPPIPQDLSSSAGGQQQLQIQLPAQRAHSTVPPFKRPISRRSVLIGLGGLTAATVVGGSIWWGNTSNTFSSSYPYIYRGHTQAVNGVVWSPNGRRRIASASDDKTVQLWNAANGEHVLTYREHTAPVHAVVWSPDGRHIASGSDDTTVQVWNARSGEYIFAYRGHAAAINALAWSPDRKRLASASSDHTVQVWNATDGVNVLTYQGHKKRVTSVAWRRDGSRLASGSDDTTVQIWDAINGGSLLTYRGHTANVTAVAWSPDGNLAASASLDGTVQVWDAVDGGNVVTFQYIGGVTAMAWSLDGKLIALASSDDMIHVWETAHGENVLNYQGHTNDVNALAWSPDSKLVASASSDDTVQVWYAGEQ